MDQQSQQDLSAEDAHDHADRARRSLAESAATPSRGDLLGALETALESGWTCLQDLQAKGTTLAVVLVGPGGVLVIETASSLVAHSTETAAAGACWLAALLPAHYRAAVRSCVVVADEPDQDRAMTVVGLGRVGEWIAQLPTVFSADAAASVSEQLRSMPNATVPALLTTRDLLPVQDGRPEAEIPRQRGAGRPAPAAAKRRPRPLSRRRKQAMLAHPSARRTSPPTEAEVSMADVIRAGVVCVLVLVAMWFWGVLADVASGADRDPLGTGQVVVHSVSDTAGSSADTPASVTDQEVSTASD